MSSPFRRERTAPSAIFGSTVVSARRPPLSLKALVGVPWLSSVQRAPAPVGIALNCIRATGCA
jgi:hypothetical protein